MSYPLKNEIKSNALEIYGSDHIYAAINILKYYKKANGIIVDAGGGQGTTAIIFSNELPRHRILIFEPINNNYKIIERLAKSEPNWVPINKALGSIAEIAYINITDRITASSICDISTHIGDPYHEELEVKNKEKIQVTTLDNEINPNEEIDILKIDVQGYEMKVLIGGINTLKRTKIIIIEINNHSGFKSSPLYFEIDNHLRLNDFHLQDLYPTKRINTRLADWDAIYVRSDIADDF
jgi:FkbM family methyltransferase